MPEYIGPVRLTIEGSEERVSWMQGPEYLDASSAWWSREARSLPLFAAVLALGLGTAGCRESPQDAPLVPASVAASSAASSETLPPRAAKPKAVETLIGRFKFYVPTGWDREASPPKGSLARLRIPGSRAGSEDAVLDIQVGHGADSPGARAARWVHEFQRDDREISTVLGKSPQGQYVLVNIRGVFNQAAGSAPGYALLGVILDPKSEEPYLLKMTGPDTTVLGQLRSWREFFGGNASTEMNFKFDFEELHPAATESPAEN